jgi:hypothetical protein
MLYGSMGRSSLRVRVPVRASGTSPKSARSVAATLAAPAPRPEIRLAPATLVSAAMIELRLPNGVVVEVTNVSPTWAAAMIAELMRTS